MASLPRCPSCRGFVPSSASACPHCGATPSAGRGLGFWLKAAGAGAVSVTMMACYGLPPDEPLPDDDGTSEDSGSTLDTESDSGTTAGEASSGEESTGAGASPPPAPSR